VQCGAQPDEASNTLTRRPAIYNRILDLRTRQPADALIRVLEHRLNANISRSSCPYLRAIFGRHHPLSSGLRKNPRQNRSGKKRQKATMNLSQYDAFCRWQFAANCRLLPPAVMHTPSATKEPRQFSVRHLPLAQLWRRETCRGVAQQLRKISAKIARTVQRHSTQLNAFQHQPSTRRKRSLKITVRTPGSERLNGNFWA
jgi:hypothetical protein